MSAPAESEPTARETERRAITGRAGIVAAGTLVSRALGLGRDLVLAAVFSRGATDAFMVAFTIPNVLRQLLAEGAVQNAVLPVLTQTKEQDGDEAARSLFAAVRGLSWLLLVVVAACGSLFAPALVSLFAGGFRDQPGQFERTVELTRWLFPYIFFMGTFAMGVAALNTYKRFTVTAFAPALLNVSFIACALTLPALLASKAWDPILAMAIGALLGGALQVLAQGPSLRAIGFWVRPRLDLGHPGLRLALRRMVPVLAGIGIYYIDVILARRFLSEMGVGPQTYFGFALRLCDFPQGIFVMAIQTAALPSLAALAARGDHEDFAATYAFGLRLTLFVGIGASALLVVLAEPIVAAVFQRGQFDAVATRETARALMAQGVGVWMVAVVRQLLAVYFAVGDTRTPVVVSALDLCVFIGLASVLREPFGHVGIGLAVAGSSAAQMLLLWVRVGRHLKDRGTREIASSALRTTLAAAVASAGAWLVASSFTPVSDSGAWLRLLPGIIGTLTFLLLYTGAAALLGSEELRLIASAARRRRLRRS